MAKCRFCAEEIWDEIVICPWCGSELSEPSGLSADRSERYSLWYRQQRFELHDANQSEAPIKLFPATGKGWRRAWREYRIRQFDEIPLGPLLVPPAPSIDVNVLPHKGQVFGLGRQDDFYGIWDLAFGRLVARFECTPDGWDVARMALKKLEVLYDPRFWRRANYWIALHVLIGLIAIPFVAFVVIGGILAATGRPSVQADAGSLVVFGTSLVGWILFVYLPQPSRVRWTALIVLVGIGLLVTSVLVVVNNPVAASARPSAFR